MVFVCHVSLHDHMIKALNEVMVRRPSSYVIILPSLVATDTAVLKIK